MGTVTQRTLTWGGVLVALALVLAGCGGDDDSGEDTASTDAAAAEATSAAPVPTTTLAEDGDDGYGDGGDGDATVGFADMPGECRAAFEDYLRAIEPTVAGLDFEGSTLAELDTVFTELEPVLDDFDERMEGLDCPELDTDDEVVREDVMAFVEDVAPGTAAFVEYSMDLAGDFTGEDGEAGAGASGDCAADMAAAQEIVDGGGTMEDLTLAELSEVGALFMSVQTNCTLDQMEEFFSQPDVEEFLGSGG